MTNRMNALTLSLVLAVSAAPGFGSEASDIEATIAGAIESLEQARQSGNSWTTTEALIAGARAALADGDLEQAAELAQRARLTADMAQQQRESEVDAWEPRVPTQ